MTKSSDGVVALHPAHDLPGSQPVAGGLPGRVHWVRYGMYRALQEELASLTPRGFGVIVSDRSPVLPGLVPEVDVRLLDYPTHDLQTLEHFPDASLDLVMSDMVLEHVDHPEAVIEASHRVLRPGGVMLHTTVFCMPYHPCPHDHWRFSPSGLERLASGFSDVRVGGFGNRRLLAIVMARLTRLPVPVRRWSPWTLFTSGNNVRYPITTWVVARK